jgi:antitoxin component of MazEF toxin-antitoxin module
MARTLTPVGDGLGLVIDQSILNTLQIDRETPLELRLSADGQGIEIRPVRDADLRRRVLESADRVMDTHEEVFRKLAR